MQISYQKAFNFVSWDFLYAVLQGFCFDDNFIKWIKFFNYKIKAFVTQYVCLSNFIPIERGSRHGDPIAPYLLLIAEILFD